MVPEKSNIRGEPKLARGRNPELKTTMNSTTSREIVTVQGVGSPVPAAIRGEQAGPGASSSSDCSVGEVFHLASSAFNVPSVDFAAEFSTTADHHAEVERKFNILRKEVEALEEFVREKKNLHKELKEMSRRTARALKEYGKVRTDRSVKEVKISGDRAT